LACQNGKKLAGSEVVFMKGNLEGYNPVNAVRPKDAEFAFVVAAKVDQTTTTPTSAGQRDLVDRTYALPVLVFEQHDRLTRHRCRQAQIRECNHVTGGWFRRRRNRGLRHRVHSTIEAEAMYPLK
jgi:hypothetical protein